MFVCKNCELVFSSSEKLKIHLEQKKGNCIKYRDVLFYCKKCCFKTNGLKKINKHNLECKEVIVNEDVFYRERKKFEDTIKKNKETIENLQNILLVEQIKNQYLNQILRQTTKLELKDVFDEKYCNLTLKPVEKCSNVNIFIQEFVKPKTDNLNIQTLKPLEKNDEPERKKKKKNYRSVDRKRLKKDATSKPKKLQIVKTELLSGKECLDKIEIILKEIQSDTDMSIEKKVKDVKIQREILLKILNINEYVKIVDKINTKLKRILKNKKISPETITKYLLLSMQNIDMRLLHFKYHVKHSVDIDEIQNLSLCFDKSIIIHEEYEEIKEDKFFSMFSNYAVLYFPLECLVKKYFEKNKFNNIIYVPFKNSSDSNPFSFYILVQVSEDCNRKWDMDSRLEELSTNFIHNTGNYMIKLFRRLYFEVFNDNIYRENFKNKCPHLENEFLQLTQNIFSLINPISFSLKLIEIVKKHSSYIPNEQNDSFNLRMDDNLQKIKYKNYKLTIEDNYELASKIFDNISKEESQSWVVSFSEF